MVYLSAEWNICNLYDMFILVVIGDRHGSIRRLLRSYIWMMAFMVWPNGSVGISGPFCIVYLACRSAG